MIPVQYYSAVFYNILLLFVLIVFSQSSSSSIFDEGNIKAKKAFGLFLLLFTTLYMGLRPISFTFGDMGVYAIEYKNYINGAPLITDKDVAFNFFLKTCSQVMPVQFFFFLCAFLYTYCHYLVSKKFFGNYWFYSFLILIVSMSFWAYGTNGIRNGLATALFLVGVSRNKWAYKIAWIIFAMLIHKSLLVPAIAYLIATLYGNTKVFLAFWFLSIPLSLALGSFWENFFFSLGFGEEDRLAGYLSDNDILLDKIVTLKVGFRWDFLLYSATGVYAGWYYIIKKKFEDIIYNKLFNVYLIVNAFWVLVIRANFSNRFAYLSWFLLGLIIIYPLLKNTIFNDQHKVVGRILIIYFLFSYVLNFILAK